MNTRIGRISGFLVLAAVVGTVFLGTMSSPAPATAATIGPLTCHISSTTPSGYASRTRILFPSGMSDANNSWMSSKTSAGRRTQETVNASLPAGTYRVTLESFDAHSENGGQGQTREQYYLELKDASGTIVGRTGDSADLKENQDYLTPPTIVNTALLLGAGIAKVTAAHSAYPDNSNHNSITAVCAAFDRVQTPVLTPTLGMSKRVRNITQNSGEAVGVSASPNDIVEFIIRISNSGTGDATNVNISDSLPSRLSYIQGTTTLDGSGFADGITSGINIGTIVPNQTRTFSIQAREAGVNP